MDEIFVSTQKSFTLNDLEIRDLSFSQVFYMLIDHARRRLGNDGLFTTISSLVGTGCLTPYHVPMILRYYGDEPIEDRLSGFKAPADLEGIGSVIRMDLGVFCLMFHAYLVGRVDAPLSSMTREVFQMDDGGIFIPGSKIGGKGCRYTDQFRCECEDISTNALGMIRAIVYLTHFIELPLACFRKTIREVLVDDPSLQILVIVPNDYDETDAQRLNADAWICVDEDPDVADTGSVMRAMEMAYIIGAAQTLNTMKRLGFQLPLSSVS